MSLHWRLVKRVSIKDTYFGDDSNDSSGLCCALNNDLLNSLALGHTSGILSVVRRLCVALRFNLLYLLVCFIVALFLWSWKTNLEVLFLKNPLFKFLFVRDLVSAQMAVKQLSSKDDLRMTLSSWSFGLHLSSSGITDLCCGPEDQTHGFLHTRQALCTPSHIPTVLDAFNHL